MAAADWGQVGGQKAPLIPPISKHIPPGKDFYDYVNLQWQKRVSIPRFASAFGISEEIEDRVRGDLMKSIHSLLRSDSSHPLALLAKSVLHTPSQDNNVRDVRHFLQTFGCIETREDIAREIGRLNRSQLRAPLTFTVNADTFKSSICRVHIYEPVLGLPAKHHYTVGARNRVIMQYANLLKKSSTALEVSNLESVIAIEKSILRYLSEGDSLRDPSESYIPHTITELEKVHKNIPWAHMLRAWGMTEKQIRESIFIVTNSKYIEALNGMFETLDLDQWRIWFRAGVVLSLIEYLPPPFDDWHYELFGRRLRGNSQKLPQKYLMLRVLQTFATQNLSRVFVEDHVSEKIKYEAQTMTQRLRKATIHRIKMLKWMQNSTKEMAIEKVRQMRFQVAYPNAWTNEFTGLRMDGERLISNILALSAKDTDRMLKNLGDGCGESDGTWEDGAFDVNAYYYPDKNQLTIPAGMLRSPFFDLRRSVAWNYGGIGCAIGHEITHGFDADGKNYDVRGSYKDWWTVKDNQEYVRLTQGLVALYDGEEYAGGKVDGNLTLSENIADIGGVAIALDALHDYLNEKRATASERREAFEDFFLSYAISWRNKDRPRKAKQSLYLDVHSPAPLRVNIVCRQFAEFFEAFGIGPEDPGWIPPEDRIQLW
jgi:putative endopeptidase